MSFVSAVKMGTPPSIFCSTAFCAAENGAFDMVHLQLKGCAHSAWRIFDLSPFENCSPLNTNKVAGFHLKNKVFTATD